MGGTGSSGVIKVKVACNILLIALVLVAPHESEAAISCAQVLPSISSCIGYIQRGGAVSPSCCDGVKYIVKAASASTADLQAFCGCVKALAPSIGAKAEFVNTLPVKCGVKFPYTYSPSMDCSKVK